MPGATPAPEAKPEPMPQAAPEPTPQARPAKKAKPAAKRQPEPPHKTAPAPTAAAEPKPARFLPDVAILVSKDVPAYTEVSSKLTAELKHRAKAYTLNGNPTALARAVDKIQWSEQDQVVAVGLQAARAAQRLSGKQVIFCQVFNYEDNGLVTSWMKGVSMIPNLRRQFRAWKALDPDLQKVGVITGKNKQHVITQARDAARDLGIEVIHRVVGSDKEMLYTFQRLAPEIQGLWLLPDNRVLSRHVIRSIMSYSVKQGKEVVVFNPQLLKVGGLMSVTSRHTDIAAQVIARLRQAQGQANIPGPEVIPLAEAQIQINTAMAKRLGLVIPQQYRRLAYEP
jgi:ABC-type uncharacterized transport system substrate-binding protein